MDGSSCADAEYDWLRTAEEETLMWTISAGLDISMDGRAWKWSIVVGLVSPDVHALWLTPSHYCACRKPLQA